MGVSKQVAWSQPVPLAEVKAIGRAVDGTVNDVMLAAAKGGYSTATDLADYLAGRGMPFRQAHEVVGKVVRLLMESGRRMEELTLEELKGFYPEADEEALARLKVEASVNSRNHLGGTAKAAVLEHIRTIREIRAKT